jgi:hypothetical protein
MADNKYIYPDGQRWVVRCKDFDLTAKGFSFSKFGNKELALKEAISYRNEQIAKHHPIVLWEPEKPLPPKPKIEKPVKEKEPTDEEVAKRWSKFRSPNAEYGPNYIKTLSPQIQASLQHTKEALQLNGDQCRAYHYTGAWDAAFSPACQGHSSWRPPNWENNREVILTNWVKEQLLKLRERNLNFTEPWINSWLANKNLIE